LKYIDSNEAFMTTVVLDDALRQRLQGLKAEIELRDETGKVVGHVLPAEKYQSLLYAWAKNRLSDEELRRRSEEPGGRSLADILADLQRS
jgi:hypothetical protein